MVAEIKPWENITKIPLIRPQDILINKKMTNKDM